MSEFRVAHTTELDDIDKAVAEITRQLDPTSFLKNSAMIIACHDEFFETGVVQAICNAVNIPTLGYNSMFNYVQGCPVEQFTLSVFVMTSDRMDFKTFLATDDDFLLNPNEPIDKMMSVISAEGRTPEVAFVIETLNYEIGNDIITKRVADAFAPTVLFGTVSIGFDEVIVSENHIICDTTEVNHGVAVLCIYGDFPKDYVYYALKSQNLFSCEAIVTEANNNVVKSINYTPVAQFFREMGVVDDSNQMYSFVLPLMVDQRDGTEPIARSISAFTPDGRAITTANIPVGSILSLGSISEHYVLETANEAVKMINDVKPKAIIALSCAVRNLSLDANLFGEIEVFRTGISKDIPIFFSYSGGEICPVKNRETGEYFTRMHNNSLILLLFR